ncbi:MAG: hypothetical protein ACK5LT_02240 [Lachnospirales bacterium]
MNDIFDMYLNHINYYILIYLIIIISNSINLILIMNFCKSNKIIGAFLLVAQNIILTMALVLLSICNVVVLDQWIDYSAKGMTFSFGDIYVCLIFASAFLTLLSGIICIISLIKYMKAKYVE